MNTPASRYDYTFDPAGDSTAARICRLAGYNRRVLELGCAAGAMSAVLTRHNQCTVTGVEYDAKAAAEAALHCKTVITASLDGDQWMEPLQGRRFDTIIAADVLEHLHQPAQCLRQLHMLMSDDSRLVISVPNLAHSGVLAALLCDDFPYVDVGLLDRTHVHFFTAGSLRRMLEHCGYEVSHSETVDAGAWHPEFARYWNALPPAMQTWLESNPAGRAFQVIMVAHAIGAGARRPAAPEDTQVVSMPAAQWEWLRQFPEPPSTPQGDVAEPIGGLRQQLARLLGRR